MFKFKPLAVGIAVVLLAACGAKKGSRSDISSRGIYTGPTPIPTNRKYAECSRVLATSIPLSGQLGTYYNPTTHMIVSDYVQLNVTAYPSQLTSSATHYIQAYRWTDGTDGFQMNSIPVRMLFMNKVTGNIVSSSTVDRISKSTLETIIANANLGNLNITVNNFFEQHYVILTGMEIKWKAVTFAFYNSETGVNAISSGDGLLPPFYADPNFYAERNAQPNLYSLHPNYAYRTSGASDNEFKNLSDEICREFFSTIRMPSSVGDDDKVKILSENSSDSEAFSLSAMWSQITDFFASAWAQILNLF